MHLSSTLRAPGKIQELKSLYNQQNFQPRAWPDISDPNFLCLTLVERSIALLAEELGGKLLDVGCGQQPYVYYFRHIMCKQACDVDAERGNMDFQCPAHCIPLPSSSLDAILCSEVLAYVSNPMAAWHEFGRILKPRGKLLLAAPMYWPWHNEPHDCYRYTEHGLRHLAGEAGFDLIRVIPRGGSWAFFGQVGMHTLPFFKFRWQRRLWNHIFLELDRWRVSPRLTLGWTVLGVRLP
jgi:SAM-dependent methyltransferase